MQKIARIGGGVGQKKEGFPVNNHCKSRNVRRKTRRTKTEKEIGFGLFLPLSVFYSIRYIFYLPSSSKVLRYSIYSSSSLGNRWGEEDEGRSKFGRFFITCRIHRGKNRHSRSLVSNTWLNFSHVNPFKIPTSICPSTIMRRTLFFWAFRSFCGFFFFPPQGFFIIQRLFLIFLMLLGVRFTAGREPNGFETTLAWLKEGQVLKEVWFYLNPVVDFRIIGSEFHTRRILLKLFQAFKIQSDFKIWRQFSWRPKECMTVSALGTK